MLVDRPLAFVYTHNVEATVLMLEILHQIPIIKAGEVHFPIGEAALLK